MSKEDCTVRMWNYITGKCELAHSYTAFEKDSMKIRDSVKPLNSIAIHPSGFYMAIGFIDRVRIFHILHNELREYNSKDIKGCQNIAFSNTG